jgi:hypothetical protein
LLTQAGKTWKSYQEDIDLAGAGASKTGTVMQQNQWTVPLGNLAGTSPSYTNPYNGSHQYDYAAKHCPTCFFTDTNGGNDTTSANPLSQRYAPLQQLALDLAANTVADYNWITPNQFNDMHTALSGPRWPPQNRPFMATPKPAINYDAGDDVFYSFACG